jgi:hypothetical protein
MASPEQQRPEADVDVDDSGEAAAAATAAATGQKRALSETETAVDNAEADPEGETPAPDAKRARTEAPEDDGAADGGAAPKSPEQEAEFAVCPYHRKRKRKCPGKTCPHLMIEDRTLDGSTNDMFRGPPAQSFLQAETLLSEGQAQGLAPHQSDAALNSPVPRSDDLSWDLHHRVNKEGKYCYCGLGRSDPSNLSSPLVTMLPCAMCRQWYHAPCLVSPLGDRAPLPGDLRYAFVCARCNEGAERFEAFAKGWAEAVQIAMFNLTLAMRRADAAAGRPEKEFYGFHGGKDICEYMDTHWTSLLTGRERTKTWNNTVAGTLSSTKHLFTPESRWDNGRQGYWTVDFGDPSCASLNPRAANPALLELSKAQQALLAGASAQPVPSPTASGARMRRTESAEASQAAARAEALANEARSLQGPMLYPLMKYHPHSYALAKQQLGKQNSAPQMKINQAQHTATNDKGYRTCRTAFGVRSGLWYCEITVKAPETLPQYEGKAAAHCRLGWSTARGDKQAPVGFDAFGFGFRDTPAARFNRARGVAYGKPYGVNDVVGLLIWLPPADGASPAAEDSSSAELEFDPAVQQDLVDDAEVPAHTIQLIGGIAYSTSQPATESPQTSGGPDAHQDLPVHDSSAIAYFVNGESMGVAYTDIPRGTYYPSASLYYGASVQFNFGPTFAHPVSTDTVSSLLGVQGRVPRPISRAAAPPPRPPAPVTADEAKPEGAAGSVPNGESHPEAESAESAQIAVGGDRMDAD